MLVGPPADRSSPFVGTGKLEISKLDIDCRNIETELRDLRCPRCPWVASLWTKWSMLRRIDATYPAFAASSCRPSPTKPEPGTATAQSTRGWWHPPRWHQPACCCLSPPGYGLLVLLSRSSVIGVVHGVRSIDPVGSRAQDRRGLRQPPPLPPIRQQHGSEWGARCRCRQAVGASGFSVVL